MTCRWILGIVVVSTGCIHIPTAIEVTRARASSELRCPAEKIEVTRRSDILGPYQAIMDVEGCGKVARYDVIHRYNQWCIREPDPDPADLAAFKATSHVTSHVGRP